MSRFFIYFLSELYTFTATPCGKNTVSPSHRITAIRRQQRGVLFLETHRSHQDLKIYGKFGVKDIAATGNTHYSLICLFLHYT